MLRRPLVAVSLVLFLCGCVVSGQKTQITPQITSLFEGEYKVDPGFEKARPRSVAVLPFVNKAENQQASEPVRRGFYNHFSSLPFKDLELNIVDARLRGAGLTEAEKIAKTPPVELGKILDVDAVIFGEISNFDKLYAAVYSQVSVGAEIRMYETKTGGFLWSGKHVARIHEGGISVTPVGIIATVIATAVNVRDVQLLRACDDLFRDMVKTIPLPTDEEALRPPAILMLTQDTKGLPRKAGDEIKVVMQGDKGLNATFDIGDYRRGIMMREMEPGWYLGAYKVLPGDNVSKATITGHLKDSYGSRADWVDALGSVTFDTAPPVKIRAVASMGRNGSIHLKWQKSPENDLAGYNIYRSNTPLSGFALIAGTEYTEYSDQGLVNSQKYFYRVAARDAAGNEGEASETVQGMPVAPGPTRVSGRVETDTVWHSGAGPYIIEGELRVLDKATLTIEPGTEIRSKGEAIVVEGSIRAVGDELSLITFDAADPQGWKGIVFSGTREKENILKRCAVRGARAGVTCSASSPRIEECEISGNDTGVGIDGSFSRPVVTGNQISRNRGFGIAVSAAAQPLIELNTVADNAKGGIVVSESSPLIRSNWIGRNLGPGIKVGKSQAVIIRNSIYDNGSDIQGEDTGALVNARDNWWGTVEVRKIIAGVRGRVDINPVLDGPTKDAKSLALPLLGELPEAIRSDGYLLLANSPYRVKKETAIENGARLFIEPGVTLEYDQGSSINVKDGGITAAGTRELPVVFTASGSSEAPGFYRNAVKFTEKTAVNSSFRFCVFRYSETAIDIYFGAPEITLCDIYRNSQNGIYCRNDSAPIISYSSFRENGGEGAVKIVGMSRPRINFNSFENNTLAVQAFSTLVIDARNNWWGAAPPDRGQIWGGPENIETEPHLARPDDKVFVSIKDFRARDEKR